MKSISSFSYKAFVALVLVMLVFTALPVRAAYAATSGPGDAGTGANVNGPGTINWTNPGNVISNNNQYATVAVNNTTSEYLQATNYGFLIPAAATINGIQVTIGRYGSTGLGSDVRDSVVSLVKGGVISGSNLAANGTDWPGAEAAANYGGTANLWGTTWTPAEINAANFGVALSVTSANNRTASVDYIQITVTYTLPPTTTTVASSLNPSNFGDSVTFTATVAPAAATGTVTFRDGAVPISPAVAVAGGVATFSTTTLAVGSHNITAVYSGDSNYGGSTSTALVQNVYGPPSIISADNTTFTVLNAGNFTVLASGNPPSTFTTAGPLPAGINLTPAGALTGTPASGTSGPAGTPYVDYPFVITASNGVNPDATQNFTLRVVKHTQTISNFNPPGSAQYGTSFTVNPTASSGLPVTVTVSGGCTIAGNVVTMTSSSLACNLTATQAGNADYNPVSVSDTVTAGKAGVTVTVEPSPHSAFNPSQSTYSHPMTFIVTVTSAGGIPTGDVRLTGGNPGQNILATLDASGVGYITINNNPLTFLNVTTLLGAPTPHTLTIAYLGGDNFSTDSETVYHTIMPAPTQIAITSDVNPSSEGQTVTFTVTVSPTPPGLGIPPGSVTLWDGSTQIGASTTLVNGVATFTISTLTFGSHNISARFVNSNDNYAASNNSTNPYVQNVRRATTTALTSDNNPSIYGENVTFTATVTSGTPGTISGTVRFLDGATVLGTGTLTGGVATFTTNALVVGTHPITAVYLGDNTYATSTSNEVNQVVNQATLTVTANNQTITYGDADPVFTFTYSGFLLGDTAAVINTPPTCDVPTTPHINFGTYPIACSGAADDHYTFNYVAGTLTVAQKALTITADNQGKLYGALFTFTGNEFTATGLIFNDTVTSVTLTSAGAPTTAPVGTYPIVPTNAVGTGLANYAITYVNGTMTVGNNVITISANNQTKTYGDVFTFLGTEFTVAGLQPGDSVSSVTLTSAGAPSAADVGTYAIVPSNAVGVGLGNYTIVYNNGTMDVNQRALTFDPDSQSKVYGSVFTAYTGTFTGLRAGDNITPVYDSAGAPAAALVGTYPITVTLNDPGGKLGNYIVTIDPAPAAALTVTQKALTITANNQTNPYGTAFTFDGTEFTINGLTNSDTVTSVTLTSAGASATATVAGSPYPIVPSAAVGTGLNNYAITYVNGTMTVTRPDLVITSDNQTKTYGDVFLASDFTGSIVGIQNGDNITATYDSLGAPANAAVGVYDITITVNANPAVLANYNVILNVGKLTVTRRDLTVVADNLTKIYGDPVTLTGTVTGVQPGDGITFTYSSPGTALTAPVGTYAVAITLNDPLNRIGNYNFTLTPGTLTITLRDLIVTPDDKSKEYGTWFLAFTGTISGIQNNDNITANYSSAGSPPSAAVGSYPIVATLNDPTGRLGNYNVILNEGTLTVGSSSLTVTAENKTITYGDPEPAFTFTYFGFAAGDTPAVIDTPPTCTVAGPHTNVGTYPIVCSGGADDAYTFTYVNGTLTINPRALVVTPTDKTKVYGDVFTAFTGTITGIQNGEAITATYDSAGAPATAAVAAYPITAVLNAPAGVLANYNVTLNTGTLTVIQRALTVTPADKTKIYGDVFTAFTGTITGVQNGDPISVTYASTGAPATATVGTYPITATLLDPAGALVNYAVTINTGTLTVTQRALIVTPDNKTKVFGTTFTAFTGIVTGIQNGDNITVTYDSPGAPAAAPVGTYPITATLNDPGGLLTNYTVTLNQGTLSVGLTILTVTAENKVITYGDPDPAFTFTYSGFIGGDTPAVLDTLPSCQVSVPHNNVGTFPIVCAGGVDNNYVFSYIPGTLTVTPRTLIVTPDNKSKVFGDVFTAFTGTVTGIQGGDNIVPVYASTGAPANAAIGTYPITVTLNDPAGRLGNYTVTLNTGTLTVAQRVLTVTPTDASKIYGNVFTAFTGTITGIQNGDAITATYASTGSPATAIVGTYPITATLNAPAGVLANYAVTNNTGTLTVTQRDLVIQAADKTKIFGTVFTAFTGSIVGIQNGDNITVTYNSTGAPAGAAVGTYPITATLNDPAGMLPNYNVSIGTATLTVTLASQTITITTPAPGDAANGASFTVAAVASSGLSVTYTATGACTNVGDTFTITAPTGTCIVHYNQAGNANFGPAPELTENVLALPNGQTITVTTSAPTVATFGNSFDVAATASSGLTVSISVSGVCTTVDHGDGTATITIVSSNGTCITHYNQAGNALYASAPQVNETTTVDSTAPTVTANQDAAQADPTNASPINFTVVFSETVNGFDDTDVVIGGTAGATTAVVTGAGPTYNVAVSGMTIDGTVTVSIPAGAATDIAGNASFASSSTDNTVTYFDASGPSVLLVNTIPAHADNALTESEEIGIQLTQLSVKFNQDVYNPAGDSDAHDVTNASNFILVRDLGDTPDFQTVSCKAGAVTPADTQITILGVTYDTATFTATFTINGGLPVSNGTYRLFVCGTTSIVDPLDNTLALVGNGGPATDFTRSFNVNIQGGAGGNGGEDGSGGDNRLTTGGSLIPVTGFAPGVVTKLPAQPEKLAYTDLSGLRLDIPSLSVNIPIVGVKRTQTGWDLTWLENNAGYLEGSAYPTWRGNTVLTGHVLDAMNVPGPFAYLNELRSGDVIYIHADGWTYVYRVEETMLVSPYRMDTVFQHEDYDWLTLVTCENFSKRVARYTSRRVVRAVLVSVITDK